MTRHRPVLHLCGPLRDHDHVTDLALRRRSTALGASHGAARAQTAPQLSPEGDATTT
jgi:hypothetical protein